MTTHFANHTEIVVKVATWSSLKANFAHQSTCSSNGTEQNINTRSAKNLIKICAVIRPSGFRQAPVVSWSAVQTKLHCRAMRKKKTETTIIIISRLSGYVCPIIGSYPLGHIRYLLLASPSGLSSAMATLWNRLTAGKSRKWTKAI